MRFAMVEKHDSLFPCWVLEYSSPLWPFTGQNKRGSNPFFCLRDRTSLPSPATGREKESDTIRVWGIHPRRLCRAGRADTPASTAVCAARRAPRPLHFMASVKRYPRAILRTPGTSGYYISYNRVPKAVIQNSLGWGTFLTEVMVSAING